MLGAYRVRRLVEDEVLVLEAGIDLEAHLARLVEHPPQNAARTRRLRFLSEFGEEEQHSRSEGNIAAGIRQDSHLRIPIAGMPSGELGVGVELVARVPSQH